MGGRKEEDCSPVQGAGRREMCRFGRGKDIGVAGGGVPVVRRGEIGWGADRRENRVGGKGEGLPRCC